MGCPNKSAVDREEMWAVAEMPARSDLESSAPAERPLRTLIVDPSLTLLAAIGGMFRAVGCMTVLASDSETAVQVAADVPCDLVVVDHDMASSGDRQLVPVIKTLLPRAKIVVMTAWCPCAENDIVIITKSDGWLFKPFGLTDMANLFSHLGLSFGLQQVPA